MPHARTVAVSAEQRPKIDSVRSLFVAMMSQRPMELEGASLENNHV